MVSIGIGLITAGYSLMYYGLYQMRGATGGFASYILPGRINTEKGFMWGPPGVSHTTAVKKAKAPKKGAKKTSAPWPPGVGIIG